jgi:hypothetical protein
MLTPPFFVHIFKESVVQKALKIFEGKFSFFVDNIAKMDMLFGASFAKLEDAGKPFSRCGITRYVNKSILSVNFISF